MTDERLFASGWVHAFEEDTAAGAVYRPRGAKLPLSRRPRERLELDADGTARVYAPGPDDRYVEQAATWQDENGAVVIRRREGGTVWRIVNLTAERLVVHIDRKG
jgi:hypothetical protein